MAVVCFTPHNWEHRRPYFNRAAGWTAADPAGPPTRLCSAGISNHPSRPFWLREKFFLCSRLTGKQEVIPGQKPR